MINITVKESEIYHEDTDIFETVPSGNIVLEHSLISISKWESRYCKPFMGKEGKTPEETKYYIKCMVVGKPNDYIVDNLSNENLNKITRYIDSPMTATTIKNNGGKGNKEIITSELLYYWMISFTIPFECQKWHLNRLLTLINVCNVKNAPPKKQSASEIMSRNAALNASRKQAMKSSG